MKYYIYFNTNLHLWDSGVAETVPEGATEVDTAYQATSLAEAKNYFLSMPVLFLDVNWQMDEVNRLNDLNKTQ